MNVRGCPDPRALIALVGVAVLAGCGGSDSPVREGESAGAAPKPSVVHFANADLKAHLPAIGELAGEWSLPDPTSTDDFSGDPETVSACDRGKAAGIQHSAKLYATNSVGSTSDIKAAFLDFGSVEQAQAYVARLEKTGTCKLESIQFKKVPLTGKCDQVFANAGHSSDDGSAAGMACRRGNRVANLAVYENTEIHPEPFVQSGLQGYFDVITAHFDTLDQTGRALP